MAENPSSEVRITEAGTVIITQQPAVLVEVVINNAGEA